MCRHGSRKSGAARDQIVREHAHGLLLAAAVPLRLERAGRASSHWREKGT